MLERHWRLGEVLNALIHQGRRLVRLQEEDPRQMGYLTDEKHRPVADHRLEDR